MPLKCTIGVQSVAFLEQLMFSGGIMLSSLASTCLYFDRYTPSERYLAKYVASAQNDRSRVVAESPVKRASIMISGQRLIL